MPANLPPQYHEAEKRYRAANTPADKLAALEEMLAIMPKHKGTDKLQADIKRRISKLKGLEQKSGGKKTYGFNVKPEGAGQVALVGPPNSGKSSLVRALTRAEPEVADYPFTTRAPLAGMCPYEDVQVQLVDLPPLAEEYIEPWLPDLIRRADLLVIMLDLTEDPSHQLSVVENLLGAKRIFLTDGPNQEDDRPGVIKPHLLLANKLDHQDAEETLELFREIVGTGREILPVSTVSFAGLAELPARIFQALNVVRAYTKTPGKPADKHTPFILPRNSTVLDLAYKIHKDIAGRFQYARIWGGDKYDGQMVQRDYVLCDRDIIEIHA